MVRVLAFPPGPALEKEEDLVSTACAYCWNFRPSSSPLTPGEAALCKVFIAGYHGIGVRSPSDCDIIGTQETTTK